jgi:tetratricopeptide (TPR) repeat protein
VLGVEQPASALEQALEIEQPTSELEQALEIEQPAAIQEGAPPEAAEEPAAGAEQPIAQAAEPGTPGMEAELSTPVEEPTVSRQTTLIEARDLLVQRQPTQAAQLYSQLIKQDYRLEEIVKDLQDALYSFPLDIDMWIALGDALNRSADLQEALNAYTKAEELVR